MAIGATRAAAEPIDSWPEKTRIDSLWDELLRAWKAADAAKANEITGELNAIMISFPKSPLARYLLNKFAYMSAAQMNDFFAEVRSAPSN